MKLFLLFPLLACLWLAVACDGNRQPLPESLARTLKTPDGSEVAIACVPSVLDDVDPVALATAMVGFNIHTPSSIDTAATRVATLMPPEAANSLRTLVPVDSPDGSVWCCSDRNNASFGDPQGGGGLFGFGAGEEQLDQMGRLCGGIANSEEGALRMRVDLYVATPGATEAYKREAEVMRPGYLREDLELENQGLLFSIGDERKLTRILTKVNDEYVDTDLYELIFRRRNIIARIELSYGSFSAPGKGPPELLLEYAAQLDRNIEAAAQ